VNGSGHNRLAQLQNDNNQIILKIRINFMQKKSLPDTMDLARN
jgi:hypothetical protein